MSVTEAIERVFIVGTIHLLEYLKDLTHKFILKCTFATIRSGNRIACNRVKRWGKNIPALCRK